MMLTHSWSLSDLLAVRGKLFLPPSRPSMGRVTGATPGLSLPVCTLAEVRDVYDW